MLITFIVLYLLASIGIGLYAATRVHNTADYAVAGRSLPLAVVIATTFATWFGSETVLGVSARFVDGGLGAVVEDPFGASMCLILVGLFFAYKLYQKNLITLGDYYRQRYGRVIEVACSAIILFSYLGWVAAQITALGLVFNLLTQGHMSVTVGMVVGTAIVLVYTLYGGMWCWWPSPGMPPTWRAARARWWSTLHARASSSSSPRAGSRNGPSFSPPRSR